MLVEKNSGQGQPGWAPVGGVEAATRARTLVHEPLLSCGQAAAPRRRCASVLALRSFILRMSSIERDPGECASSSSSKVLSAAGFGRIAYAFKGVHSTVLRVGGYKPKLVHGSSPPHSFRQARPAPSQQGRQAAAVVSHAA